MVMRTTFIPTDRRISRTSSLTNPSGTAIGTAMTRWPTSTPTSATCTTAISTDLSALRTPQIQINGQIWADQLQPVAGTIPAGRAKAKHLAALAQPVLFGGVRRPPACSSCQTPSGAKLRWRAMSSVHPWQRLVRCSPWAISPWCS